MLTADRVPNFTGSTIVDVRSWWDEMIALGVITHPDDDPSDLIYIETGSPMFNSSACRKIRSAYKQMLALFGSEVYEVGLAAYMENSGYQKNPAELPGAAGSYWIPTTQ